MSRLTILYIVCAIYLILAIWSILMIRKLKVGIIYKFILGGCSIVLPPLGFGLTLWTRYRLKKKDDSDKKDKPDKKKK